MPFYKNYKKKPCKKNYKRNYKKKCKKPPTSTVARQKVTFSSGKHILAEKFIGKLPYSDTVVLAAGTSDIPNYHVFRWTSINDPDYTGVGHQARFNDELSPFYAHYRVIGAKAKITFSLINPAGGAMIVGLRNSAGTANQPGNQVELIERPDVNHIIINAERPSATLTKYYSAKKVFGAGKIADLTSVFNSNPSEEYYLNLHSCNMWPAGAPQQVSATVQLTYIVLCTERKQQLAS